MIAKRYQLLFLAAVILAAYYPAVLSGFSKIDDYQTVNGLSHLSWKDLRAVVLPSVGGGFYYRPLIGLNFFFDRNILGFYPGLMHIENILLHVGNAILVYFLTLHILPHDEKEKSFFPLLSALLFGLHPVNSESVNWISGRTDILAGIFMLGCALFLLKYRELHENKYFVLAFVSLLAGGLSKETAVAFLPGFFLILNAEQSTKGKGQPTAAFQSAAGYRQQVVLLFISAGMMLAIFMLRSMAFTTNSSRIGLTMTDIFGDPMHSLLVTLQAFGFYMKKLVCPVPLNFAIMDVDPLYELVGVPLAALTVYIATRKTLVSALFVSAVLFLIPSFVIAFGQLAWTPYAERYAYISSAFFIVSSVVYVHDLGVFRPGKTSNAVIVITLMILFSITINRSMIWHNDIALYRDTVEKSPFSRDMRVMYGSLLAEDGKYDEALKQLEIGRSIPSLVYDERFDLNTAFIYSKQGKIDDAIKLCNIALAKSGGTSLPALKKIITLLAEKEQANSRIREKENLRKEIVTYVLKVYELGKDPHLLYELGVFVQDRGDIAGAERYFTQAMGKMADNDLYKEYARRRLKKLLTSSQS